jgi:hypothetical protein
VDHSVWVLGSCLQQEWSLERPSLFFNGAVILQVEVPGLVSPHTLVMLAWHYSYVVVIVIVRNHVRPWDNVDCRCVGLVLKPETFDSQLAGRTKSGYFDIVLPLDNT